MAFKHPSAPSRASGLIHVNVRLTTRYVVGGNDLAQHRKLSMQARGLALYLQSLPAGASVGVKAIAAQCPNSELSIARAMRELEAVGYLKRFRERLPDGRFVHRTISYNRPGAEPEPVRATPPRPVREKPAPPAPRPAPPPPIPLAERHRAAAELLAAPASTTRGCCSPSATSSGWPPASRPGSTAARAPTPSAAPSPRASPPTSPTRPASSPTA